MRVTAAHGVGRALPVGAAPGAVGLLALWLVYWLRVRE